MEITILRHLLYKAYERKTGERPNNDILNFITDGFYGFEGVREMEQEAQGKGCTSKEWKKLEEFVNSKVKQ